MKISKIVFLLFIFQTPVSYGQMKSEKESMLIKTFEFIIQQQNTLESIKQNYPQLSIEANIAEVEFNQKYGTALSNIYFESKDKLGVNFKSYLVKLEKQLNQNFMKKKMSKKEAFSFIKKVKNRTRGKITSEYLKVLQKYKNNHGIATRN